MYFNNKIKTPQHIMMIVLDTTELYWTVYKWFGF